jgi:polyvinyl alcohol dehydrogenase (cytochrome)
MVGSRRRGIVIGALLSVLLLASTYPSQAAVVANWSGYLFAGSHSSYNAAATAITPSNAAALTRYWQWVPPAATRPNQPSPSIWASPTVVGSRVYIGTGSGDFYALDLATRSVVWKRFIGFVTTKSCSAEGFVATATVVPDASRGGQLTVYVAAADGYLYALKASDGTTVWRSVVALPSSTQSDYYNWGSPTVANGRIYQGISSECDQPLVRGGVKGFSQATGAAIGTWYSVPSGTVGGSVWSSIAVNSGGSAFATTGNAPTGTDGEAVVRLNGTTLARQDVWHVPASQSITDADFGASPTLFSATLSGVATPMVGACNKNGRYYAFRQQNLAAGPVWQIQAAAGSSGGSTACLTSAIWDGHRLFLAATKTTIGGTQYAGSVRRLDPATGAVLWARGLGKAILGSPTLNGSGVLAAGSYALGAANVVYLLNSATGQVLTSIPVGNHTVFGQPVFADGYLLIPTASASTGLLVYRP